MRDEVWGNAMETNRTEHWLGHTLPGNNKSQVLNGLFSECNKSNHHQNDDKNRQVQVLGTCYY